MEYRQAFEKIEMEDDWKKGVEGCIGKPGVKIDDWRLLQKFYEIHMCIDGGTATMLHEPNPDFSFTALDE